MSSNKPDIHRYGNYYRNVKRRRHRSRCYHRSPLPETRKRSNSVSGLKVLVPANQRNCTAVEYRLQKLIRRSQRYEDYFTSEMQKIRKKVAMQMKDQVFSGKDLISAINYLTEFKRECDSSRIPERAAVWLFRDFINERALAANEARMTLSCNDTKKHEVTITSYTEIVNQLLRCYTTDTPIAKADEKIHNFRQGLLALRDISQNLLDLTLRFSGVYNEQTLIGFLVEDIFLSIRSIMCRWWAGSRGATLEYLMCQVRYLLFLEGRNWKTAKK